MQQDNSLTILGAGIIGICCALEAVEAGFDVTVIDRSAPGEGASQGIAGIISPWSVVPQAMPGIWKDVPKWLLDPKGPVKVRWRDMPTLLPWVRSFLGHATRREAERISEAMAWLMQDNINLYRTYLKDTPGEHLVRDSHLITVFRESQRPDLKDLASQLRLRSGADLEVVQSGDIQALEPALSPTYTYALVVKNQSRTTDPGRVCKTLANKAQALGVTFLRHDIARIEPQGTGGFRLAHPDGAFQATRLLVTAGAWSHKLLRPLGIRLPLIGERGYHLVFPNPDISVENSIADASAKIVLSQMDAGIRVAGTAEFADPDAPPNYARARALLPLAKRMLPDLNTERPAEWMGVRPSFPDNLPVVDRLGGFENLFCAFGHSHYGFGMAPQTARLVRQLLQNVKPNRDISAVSWQRF